MDKTIVVAVENAWSSIHCTRSVCGRHANFKAHDETNEAHFGDVVRIGETRPISKRRPGGCWKSSAERDHTIDRRGDAGSDSERVADCGWQTIPGPKRSSSSAC